MVSGAGWQPFVIVAGPVSVYTTIELGLPPYSAPILLVGSLDRPQASQRTPVPRRRELHGQLFADLGSRQEVARGDQRHVAELVAERAIFVEDGGIQRRAQHVDVADPGEGVGEDQTERFRHGEVALQCDTLRFRDRLGQLGLDRDEFFGSLRDADLTYVTVGGEYRFNEGWYDSGVYFALGGYRLEGTALDGGESRDSSLGLAVGITGELKVNRWLGVLLELSGHYVDFDEAQVFGMGHGGIAIHF